MLGMRAMGKTQRIIATASDAGKKNVIGNFDSTDARTKHR